MYYEYVFLVFVLLPVANNIHFISIAYCILLATCFSIEHVDPHKIAINKQLLNRVLNSNYMALAIGGMQSYLLIGWPTNIAGGHAVPYACTSKQLANTCIPDIYVK